MDPALEARSPVFYSVVIDVEKEVKANRRETGTQSHGSVRTQITSLQQSDRQTAGFYSAVVV
jgi:hypothetical protein